jgi:hypothetical protein
MPKQLFYRLEAVPPSTTAAVGGGRIGDSHQVIASEAAEKLRFRVAQRFSAAMRDLFPSAAFSR